MKTVYLDTNVVVWLAQGTLDRIGPRARPILEEAELRISPMVLIELEYLYEVQRLKLPSQEIFTKLQYEIGLRLCDLSFSSVAGMAIHEKWTRDPFDRLIVAQAKANGIATLVSADAEMQRHYVRAVW